MVAYPITAPLPNNKTRVGWSTDVTDAANDHETRLDVIENRIIGRARRTTNSSASTGSDVAVLRLDSCDLMVGKIYRITTSPLYLTSNTGDVVNANLRYDITGAAATTASSLLPGGQAQKVIVNGSYDETATIITTYTPASAGQVLSLLLTVLRAVGAGSSRILAGSQKIIEFTVEDQGIDPGDTGVDL